MTSYQTVQRLVDKYETVLDLMRYDSLQEKR